MVSSLFFCLRFDLCITEEIVVVASGGSCNGRADGKPVWEEKESLYISLYPHLIPLILMKACWRREGQDGEPRRKNPQGQNTNNTKRWSFLLKRIVASFY